MSGPMRIALTITFTLTAIGLVLALTVQPDAINMFLGCGMIFMILLATALSSDR